MKNRILVATVVLVLSPAPLLAAIVTFEGLTGTHSDPFNAPYMEDGFTVTAITGRWLEGHDSHVQGNPLPDIYGDTFTASLEVSKSGGGLFAFTSVDLSSGTQAAPVSFTIEGLLGGATVFSFSDNVGYPFETISSPSGEAIDSLRISIVRNQAEGYELDNISLNASPVPEPSTLAMFAGCLAMGLGYGRVRRSAQKQKR